MCTRRGRWADTALAAVALTFLLSAGQAQSQFQGGQQQGRSPRIATLTGLPQNGSPNPLALLTALQRPNTVQPTAGGPQAGLLARLQRRQTALQTALQQNAALQTVVQQSSSPNQLALLTALQQQQTALQTALAQTNARLTALQQAGQLTPSHAKLR